MDDPLHCLERSCVAINQQEPNPEDPGIGFEPLLMVRKNWLTGAFRVAISRGLGFRRRCKI